MDLVACFSSSDLRVGDIIVFHTEDDGDTLRSTVNYPVEVLRYSRLAVLGANYEERVKNIVMMQSSQVGRDAKIELTDAKERIWHCAAA
jgi:hypothetical protein